MAAVAVVVAQLAFPSFVMAAVVVVVDAAKRGRTWHPNSEPPKQSQSGPVEMAATAERARPAQTAALAERRRSEHVFLRTVVEVAVAAASRWIRQAAVEVAELRQQGPLALRPEAVEPAATLASTALTQQRFSEDRARPADRCPERRLTEAARSGVAAVVVPVS